MSLTGVLLFGETKIVEVLLSVCGEQETPIGGDGDTTHRPVAGTPSALQVLSKTQSANTKSYAGTVEHIPKGKTYVPWHIAWGKEYFHRCQKKIPSLCGSALVTMQQPDFVIERAEDVSVAVLPLPLCMKVYHAPLLITLVSSDGVFLPLSESTYRYIMDEWNHEVREYSLEGLTGVGGNGVSSMATGTALKAKSTIGAVLPSLKASGPFGLLYPRSGSKKQSMRSGSAAQSTDRTSSVHWRDDEADTTTHNTTEIDGDDGDSEAGTDDETVAGDRRSRRNSGGVRDGNTEGGDSDHADESGDEAFDDRPGTNNGDDDDDGDNEDDTLEAIGLDDELEDDDEVVENEGDNDDGDGVDADVDGDIEGSGTVRDVPLDLDDDDDDE